MALKENYKDDILDVSVNTKRKYRMTENPDGTVSFDDETEYTQEGDSFGASDLNAMAHAINNVSSDAEHTSYDNTTSGLVSDNVQGAIDEVVEEFEQTPITVGGETLSTIDEKLNFIIGETTKPTYRYMIYDDSGSSTGWYFDMRDNYFSAKTALNTSDFQITHSSFTITFKAKVPMKIYYKTNSGAAISFNEMTEVTLAADQSVSLGGSSSAYYSKILVELLPS